MGQQGKKSVALFGALACFLAVVAAGCGSSSSSTTSSITPAAGGGVASARGSGSTAPAEGGGGGSGRSGTPGSGARDKAGEGGPGAAGGGGEKNSNGAPLGSDTSKSGDNSIETYGTEVGGAEKAAAVAAMRSFVQAVAARDYAAICSGLAAKIRAGLAQSGKPCPVLLESLLTIDPSEARQAANGTVTHVRVGGGNAFVLFHPAGGSSLNYFVMRQEGGKWKSLGLTIGTPLNPSAAVGG
jgi:hypothetical protein